jgi:hypothetical protein
MSVSQKGNILWYQVATLEKSFPALPLTQRV